MRLSWRAANAQANVIARLLNGGTLRLYAEADGAPPLAPEEPAEGHRLLAELRFGVPAFIEAVNGRIIAHPLAPDFAAKATGLASWFRCTRDDGQTAVLDGSVGGTGSGADLELDHPRIVEGGEVLITEFVYQVPVRDGG